MSHYFAWGSLAVVAVVCLVLTVLALAAYRRTGNRKLLFVMAAFAIFAIKSALTSWALGTQAIGHETLEIVGGAGDLIIVALLVAPFLSR